MESKTENCNRPKFVERQETQLAEPATEMCDAEQEYLETMLRMELEEEGFSALAEWDATEAECVVD